MCLRSGKHKSAAFALDFCHRRTEFPSFLNAVFAFFMSYYIKNTMKREEATTGCNQSESSQANCSIRDELVLSLFIFHSNLKSCNSMSYTPLPGFCE